MDIYFVQNQKKNLLSEFKKILHFKRGIFLLCNSVTKKKCFFFGFFYIFFQHITTPYMSPQTYSSSDEAFCSAAFSFHSSRSSSESAFHILPSSDMIADCLILGSSSSDASSRDCLASSRMAFWKRM